MLVTSTHAVRRGHRQAKAGPSEPSRARWEGLLAQPLPVVRRVPVLLRPLGVAPAGAAPGGSGGIDAAGRGGRAGAAPAGAAPGSGEEVGRRAPVRDPPGR